MATWWGGGGFARVSAKFCGLYIVVRVCNYLASKQY